jgi:hypothetical protein
MVFEIYFYRQTDEQTRWTQHTPFTVLQRYTIRIYCLYITFALLQFGFRIKMKILPIS